MHHVGLDVHQRRSSLEILNEDGKRVKRLEVRGPWSRLLDQIDRQVPRPFEICYEASCGYGYLHDELARRGAQRIAVAHPGQLRLIFRSKRKHDRIDATKLAKLLYFDEVPTVHVPKADVRAWRGLIIYRRRLVMRRTAVKNQIRALLRGLGIAGIKGLWTKAGQAWLAEQVLGEADGLRREILQDELADLEGRIRRVTRALDRLGRADAGVRLLTTIPGVGRRTAEAFVAWVDDVRRFGRIKAVGAYFGLVPCQDASGPVNRLGHITRDGPPTVRGLLCEAAWQGVLRSPTIRGFHRQVMRDDADRKKIATVATAHYLARVMTAMLRSGQPWWENPELAEVAAEATKVSKDGGLRPPAAEGVSPPEDSGA